MTSQPSGTALLPPLPMDDAIWEQVAETLSLSPQQTQIVELILRGYQDKQIAVETGLAISTVRTYLRRTFDRTQTPDRIGLVLRIFAMAQEIANANCRQS